MLVGVTGGIGSGKSTVARLLGERGAVTIDADAVAREVTAPGGLAYGAVVDRFGTAERAALASVVFADPTARTELEAIVHPAVAEVIAERARPHLAAGRIVVVEVPLLVEAGWSADVVVVVDCDEEVAVERLVGRGMDEADARRRIAAQATRAERRARADHVLLNEGSLPDLERAVDALWPELAPQPR